MNAKKMMRLCTAALNKLDDLEGLLVYIPPEQEAHKFVYESIAAVKELRGVAKWETAQNVTVEQASHIHRLLSKIDYYMKLVPNGAKKELDGDSC